MKRRQLWHKNLLTKVIGAVAVIVIYIFLFIELMAYEGQSDHTNLYDAIYWVVTTITTVGYGDIVVSSPIGKIFSAFVQLSGIPLVFGILFTLVIIP